MQTHKWNINWDKTEQVVWAGEGEVMMMRNLLRDGLDVLRVLKRGLLRKEMYCHGVNFKFGRY